jgi:hypothetical protein
MTSFAFRLPRSALAANAAVPAWDGSGATFRVEETSWGFRVRPKADLRPARLLGQAAGLIAGAAALAAALSLAGPVVEGPGDVASDMRLGLGAVLAAAGLVLLRWAMRGSVVETEVDAARGEVRQVVRSLLGRRTRLLALGFAGVAGLRLAPAGRGLDVLVLDGADGGTLAVAAGTKATLAPLRRRLQRDLPLPSRGAPGPAPAARPSLRLVPAGRRAA